MISMSFYLTEQCYQASALAMPQRRLGMRFLTFFQMKEYRMDTLCPPVQLLHTSSTSPYIMSGLRGYAKSSSSSLSDSKSHLTKLQMTSCLIADILTTTRSLLQNK